MPDSGGYPASPGDGECGKTLESSMKVLRKTNQQGIARQLDGIEDSRRVHEYPAVALPAWVVDTGASYDVIPYGHCCN